ncbi:glycosyltransferase [Prosthecobacter sp.]|uniref:glycosyltransferase family 2 protein n=1 Tax=Prosthecobacter sp. TaxID=1965333 RepID=UPI0025D1BD66|nr:glycosyltransferase [Prosthecobacter sp.]
MITSRDRVADLRRTLERLGRLEPAADEILVTADGCTDGTAQMVRQEFPHCRLWVIDPGEGSIPARDHMLRQAKGELVLSLDDDSYPLDDDFVERLREVFARHPEVAVMTFPELRDGGVYLPANKSNQSPGHYVSAYPNGAAAMRRDDYLKAPGFPAFFVHAYEEPDYALQAYSQGSAVWFEPSLVIRHHFSPTNRNSLRTHHLNARNELWSVWMRCPWPWLPLVSLFRLYRQFCHACREGVSWVFLEPQWWWGALKGASTSWKARAPISWRIYLAWMRLARHPLFGPEELDKVFGPRSHDTEAASSSLIKDSCKVSK